MFLSSFDVKLCLEVLFCFLHFTLFLFGCCYLCCSLSFSCSSSSSSFSANSRASYLHNVHDSSDNQAMTHPKAKVIPIIPSYSCVHVSCCFYKPVFFSSLLLLTLLPCNSVDYKTIVKLKFHVLVPNRCIQSTRNHVCLPDRTMLIAGQTYNTHTHTHTHTQPCLPTRSHNADRRSDIKHTHTSMSAYQIAQC